MTSAQSAGPAAAEDTRVRGGYVTADDGRPVFMCASDPPESEPLADVLIIPPFGLSVSDLFLPAHYLAYNGFRVTRFDPRDAVGRSSGTILDYRLSTLRRDATLVAAANSDVTRPRVVMALSLSAVVAWALAQQVSVAGLAALVPAVDVPRTLERVTGSRVAPYRTGAAALPPVQTIFGHSVRAAQFVADMDDEGHTGLQATAERVATLAAPSLIVAAANDEYVDLSDIQTVAVAGGERVSLTVLQGSSHEIGRSVVITRQAMSQVTAFFLRVCGLDTQPREPSIAEAIAASEKENQSLRRFPPASARASGRAVAHD